MLKLIDGQVCCLRPMLDVPGKHSHPAESVCTNVFVHVHRLAFVSHHAHIFCVCIEMSQMFHEQR